MHLRVGRDTFDRLVALLATNPIFTSEGGVPMVLRRGYDDLLLTMI